MTDTPSAEEVVARLRRSDRKASDLINALNRQHVAGKNFALMWGEIPEYAAALESYQDAVDDAIALIALITQLSAALAGAKDENNELRLAICGGEDAPGYASSLQLADILEVSRQNTAAWFQAVEEATSAREAATEGWRPIETYEGGFAWLGWADIQHAEKGRTVGDKQRWCNNYGHEFSAPPTHWMPLPVPPSALSPTTEPQAEGDGT